MGLAGRGAVARPDDSRRFVDAILGDLAAGRFKPSAWLTFLARSLVRGADQVRTRPVAAAEVTMYHLVAWAGGGRKWAVVSWFLSITHLGLLGERETLGWPNRLTLLRALLPAFGTDSPQVSLVAVASDFLDGRLARRGGATAFGAFADPIADGVFWSWFALRREPNSWLRWGPLALFASSTAVIAVAYFARGRVIDYPRPIAARYASAMMQLLIALRASRPVARAGKPEVGTVRDGIG